MSIVDLVTITKQVEKFYLSGYKVGKLPVKLGDPINKSLTLNLTKYTTFNQTLSNAIAPLMTYISSYTMVTDKNGKKYPCSNIQQQKNIINSIYQDSFHEYLVMNNMIGHMSQI